MLPLCCVLISLPVLGASRGGVYQYTGDPYVQGHLNVAHTKLGKHFNSNPEHVTGETAINCSIHYYDD